MVSGDADLCGPIRRAPQVAGRVSGGERRPLLFLKESQEPMRRKRYLFVLCALTMFAGCGPERPLRTLPAKPAAADGRAAREAAGPQQPALQQSDDDTPDADALLYRQLSQALWCCRQQMFGGARKILTEVLQKAARAHGQGHWIAIEARVWLEHLDRVAALSEEDRRKLEKLLLLDAELAVDYRASDFVAARSKCEEAVQLTAELFGEKDAEYLARLSELQQTCKCCHDYEKARDLAMKLVALQETTYGRQTPYYVDALYDLAYAYAKLDMLLQAEQTLRTAYDLAATTLPDIPSKKARVLHALAAVRYHQEHYEEAMRLGREAAECFQQAANLPPWMRSRNLRRLAAAYGAWGRYAEARQTLNEALAILRPETSAYDRGDWGAAQCELAVLCAGVGDLKNAARAAELGFAAVHRTEAGDKPVSLQLVGSRKDFAFVQLCLGRVVEARELIGEVLHQHKSIWGENHSAVGKALILAGRIDGAAGHHEQAAEKLRRALKIAAERRGAESLFYADAADALGYECLWLGRTAEARALLAQALANRRRRLPAGHDKIALSLFHLAVLDMVEGEFLRGEKQLREAMQIFEQAIGTTKHPKYLAMLDAYAELLRRMGRREEARQVEARVGPILEHLKQEGCLIENLYPKHWPPTVSPPSSTDDTSSTDDM